MFPVWQQKLIDRGIWEQAKALRWELQSYSHKGQPLPGWTYPIFDSSGKIIARRWKALDSSTTPKYVWIKGSNGTAPYYMAPDLAEAIRAAGGLCYLAAGEIDLLTYHAAGIRNVLSWFGEGNVPGALAKDLADMGVTWTVYAPDLDDAGRTSAVKVRAALRGSNIGYEFKLLPSDLGNGGDTNDLWQSPTIGFDAIKFAEVLARLPELPLPEMVDKPARSANGEGNQAEDNPDYYRAIEQALGLSSEDYKKGGQGEGWSKAIACPIKSHQNDNSNPSATWHKDKHILRCFKCGQTFLAKEVAAAKNIRWTDYHQPKGDHGVVAAEIDLSAAPDIQLQIDDQHDKAPRPIPDAFIEKLLTLHQLGGFLDHAPAAAVIKLRSEGALSGAIDPAAPFTVASMSDYAASSGRNCNEGTIRKGLHQLAQLGLYQQSESKPVGRGRPTINYVARPMSEALSIFAQKLKYRAREKAYGQYVPDSQVTPAWFPEEEPAIAERLAEYVNESSAEMYQEFSDEIAQAEARYQRLLNEPAYRLDRVLSGTSIEMPPGEWETGPDFRRAYNFAQAAKRAAEGRTITVTAAAAQIGVSVKTLIKLRDEAGIIAEPQFLTNEVTPEQPVLKQVDKLAPWAAGRNHGRYLESSSGSRLVVNTYNPQMVDQWVKREAAAGHKVIAKVQKASLERFGTAEEVAQHKLERQQRYSPAHNDSRGEETEAAKRQQGKPQGKLSRGGNPLPELVEVLGAFPDTFRRDWLNAQLSLRGLDMSILGLIAEGLSAGANCEIDLFGSLPPLEDHAPVSRVENLEINPSATQAALQALYDEATGKAQNNSVSGRAASA